MNLLPLWTARVCPTNSGEIVDRRAQVFSTLRSFTRFIASSLFNSFWTTYGPFLTERLIGFARSFYAFLDFRRRTMRRSESFRLRVFLPLARRPHGEVGCRPPEDFPSPPPIGWSTGFMATPRTLGRRPIQRDFPALPITMFWWSSFPTIPIEQMQTVGTLRISPDGSRSCA